jgi:pantetheine-phosphate adenylyltransferase
MSVPAGGSFTVHWGMTRENDPSSSIRRPEHLALYPGSFDPITYGHLDVILRGRRLFDRIIVAVGQNPGKYELFSPDERVEMTRVLIEEMVAGEPGEAPVSVIAYSGLTVDFARSLGATVLLRGIRNLSDLQNEVQQAITNREVAGLETAFIVAGQDFAYTSSSLIKQITAMGQDLSGLASMVPAMVVEQLKRKKAQGHPALARLLVGRDAVE